MRLIDAYKMVTSGTIPRVDQIDTEDTQAQVQELIHHLYDGTTVQRLCFLNYRESQLLDLVKSTDINLAASAALTLLNNALPEFNLSTVV